MVASVTSSRPPSFVHLILTLPKDRKLELATKQNWNILLLSVLSEEAIVSKHPRTGAGAGGRRVSWLLHVDGNAVGNMNVNNDVGTSMSRIHIHLFHLHLRIHGPPCSWPPFRPRWPVRPLSQLCIVEVLQTLLWDTPPETSLTCSLKDDARELEWFRAGADEGFTDANPGPDETTLAYQNPDKPRAEKRRKETFISGLAGLGCHIPKTTASREWAVADNWTAENVDTSPQPSAPSLSPPPLEFPFYTCPTPIPVPLGHPHTYPRSHFACVPPVQPVPPTPTPTSPHTCIVLVVALSFQHPLVLVLVLSVSERESGIAAAAVVAESALGHGLAFRFRFNNIDMDANVIVSPSPSPTPIHIFISRTGVVVHLVVLLVAVFVAGAVVVVGGGCVIIRMRISERDYDGCMQRLAAAAAAVVIAVSASASASASPLPPSNTRNLSRADRDALALALVSASVSVSVLARACSCSRPAAGDIREPGAADEDDNADGDEAADATI
ncbi:hypothetical protein CVT25_006282, partial [Psilocybe cyanescens]